MTGSTGIFVVGYPSFVGGADTELWHVLRLWQRFRFDATLLPTWRARNEWRDRCVAIGVPTIEVRSADKFAAVPGLAGSVVISFCNGEFLNHADVFRTLQCRIVWVGCMTWLFDAEREYYKHHGPFDAYVFQSEYQRSKLLPELRQFGVRDEQCFLIRGALDPVEFPYRPFGHQFGSDFVVGRLARPDLDKWHESTWSILGAITYAKRRARLMGVNDRLLEKLGSKPDWAEVLPPAAEEAAAFLSTLHCLIAINGGAAENWPRVGLEAMAAGVPVIAENQWGWREMIDHGRTGFLYDSHEQIPDFAGKLAADETLRLEIAANARDRLVNVLANPDDLWSRWKALFEYVSAGPQLNIDDNRARPTTEACGAAVPRVSPNGYRAQRRCAVRPCQIHGPRVL